MANPADARPLLLEILSSGLLRIRRFAHAGDAAACGVEAYHLHNLPHLALTPTIDELEYYFTVEREEFLAAKPEDVDQFKEAWDRLGTLIRSLR